MTIQFNTGNNITGGKEQSAPLIALLSDGLSRYKAQITRLEVHLSDEDGNKDGQNDKRCMIEARPEGQQPIVVTSEANTNEQAVEGAIDKLMASLETVLGRKNSRKP